jgi:hypothetical protein
MTREPSRSKSHSASAHKRTPGARTSRRRKAEQRAKRRFWYKAVGIPVLVLALGVSGWLVVKVLTVKSELEASQALLGQLTAQAKEYDWGAMSTTVASLQQHSSAAAEASDDGVWRAFEVVPYLGDNLHAVRVVAESLDAVTGEVAVPAVELASSFSLATKDPATGGVDLAPVRDAESLVGTAQQVMEDIDTRLSTVNDERTVSQIGSAVTQLRTLADEAGPTIHDAGGYIGLIGALLGADGDRNYLLTFQNNAEATALGGVSASFTLLHVSNGTVTVADTASSSDFHPGERIDVPIDDSAAALSLGIRQYSNLATARPDFPTAGRLLSAYWARDRGLDVDGVISVDPLALAEILKATGPVPIADGDVLTSENAVSLLLNQVYFKYDSYAEPQKVDDYFHSAASAVIAKVVDGNFDLKTMIDALQRAVNGGSILAWSAHADEQATLDGTRIQGVLPTSNDASTVMGVYFRDQSASKLDFYLDSASHTVSDVCTGTPTPTVQTTVDISSRLTQAEADALPRYVKSYLFGSQIFVTQVYVYGPVGSTLADAQVVVAGDKTTVEPSVVDLGRPVAMFTIQLRYGQTASVAATFTGAAGSYGPLEIRGTPMVNATKVTVDQPACGTEAESK